MTEQLKPLWPDDRALAYLETNWAKYHSKYAVVADMAFEMRNEYEAERNALMDLNRKLLAELLLAKGELRRVRLGLPAQAEQETKSIPDGKCYCACKACVYCESRLEQP